MARVTKANFPRPLAPARWGGWQLRPSGRAPLELWHLTHDIAGHPAGSTVSRESIEAAGYFLPDPPDPIPNPCHSGRPRRKNPVGVPLRIQAATHYVDSLRGRANRAFAEAYLAHLVEATPPAPDFRVYHVASDEAVQIRKELTGLVGAPYPNPPVTEARVLDLLTQAVKRELRSPGDWSWTWDRSMSPEEKLAFDLFLVRIKDPLAWEAGTPESRFRARVMTMAEPFRQTKATNPRKRRKRPVRNNPPRGRSLIYTGGQLRGTWYGRHRNGKLYRHRFGGGTKAIYGLADGSIQIVPLKGRLWGMH